MGRLYGMRTILTNAFHAVQGLTTRLSDDDLHAFTDILQDEMIRAETESPSGESTAVRYDFTIGDRPDMPEWQVPPRYARAFGSYFAIDEVGDDDLRSTNLCLGNDRNARTAIGRTRERFAKEMRRVRQDGATWSPRL